MGEDNDLKTAPRVTARDELNESKKLSLEFLSVLPEATNYFGGLSERWKNFLVLPRQGGLPFGERLGPLGELSSRFIELIPELFKTAAGIGDELAENTRTAIRRLALHGWFLDLEMTLDDLHRLGDEISGGNVENAELELCGHFEAIVDKIEESVLLMSPNRSQVIRQAFAAHRNASYALSIPVLLAQTDGICKEKTGHCFFLKNRDRLPRTSAYVSMVPDDTYDYIFLDPLNRALPIAASETERNGSDVVFNRHDILHGVSLDYGTKTNSLKAMSLINYVAAVLGVSFEPAK